MAQQETNIIRLVVEDEQSLYSPFSPDCEFNENVKQYIRSKASLGDYRQPMELIVISSSPLDEERIRSAIANWVKDEKTLFIRKEKQSTQLPSAMFIIGASIIILITLLRQFIEPLTYAVILIIGTAVLGRGVTNWYEHTLGIKAKRWLISELNKTNMIVFRIDERNS
ncbi:MAG: hypothetical protein K6B42_04195 [Clostridia bacterium]|nr:hypothetical protein [Clostridia bacterium]